MTITAQVIADSINRADNRLTTLQLRYPRFIHSEVMTHRVFSRNASSSRAIPVERLIQDVLDDTAKPIHWGKNQPGMQAREQHDAPVVFRNDQVPAEIAWTRARDVAVDAARRFAKAGYHKQVVNRLLEPFAHINVLVTATDWDNFFELRDHEDAQPEIRVLAQAMRAAMDRSVPVTRLGDFSWHLPYVTMEDKLEISNRFSSEDADDFVRTCAKVSAARCARVSYMTHDLKRPKVKDDLALFERLAAARPKHLSPVEHQAWPAPSGRHANFQGWMQFRSELEAA